CDPPYGGDSGRPNELPGDNRWRLLALAQRPPARANEFAWLAHVIYHLAPAGHGYVLLRQGALVRSGTEATLRGELVRRGTIEALITLPPSLADKSSGPRVLLSVRPGVSNPPPIVFMAGEQVHPQQALESTIHGALTAWRQTRELPAGINGLAVAVPVLE